MGIWVRRFGIYSQLLPCLCLHSFEQTRLPFCFFYIFTWIILRWCNLGIENHESILWAGVWFKYCCSSEGAAGLGSHLAGGSGRDPSSPFCRILAAMLKVVWWSGSQKAHFRWLPHCIKGLFLCSHLSSRAFLLQFWSSLLALCPTLLKEKTEPPS